MALRFEDPTAEATRTSWAPIFEELRQHPGKWAVVKESAASSMAGAIKNGLLSGASAGEFDATTRSNGDGKFTIYARFRG